MYIIHIYIERARKLYLWMFLSIGSSAALLPLLAKVHVEEVEDDPEHSRTQAVAEATDPGDHTLGNW